MNTVCARTAATHFVTLTSRTRFCNGYGRIGSYFQPPSSQNYHSQQDCVRNFIRNFSDGGTSSRPDEPSSSSAKVEINPEEYTDEIKIKLPDFEGCKGKVIKWYFKEGDLIHPDDTICDIETDLFTFGMDVEDEGMGIMKEILIPAGEKKHDPGTPICILMHKP